MRLGKQLSRIKKSYIFIISVHCPTQHQVPPVLNSTFKFQTLTPSAHTPSDHLGDYLNQTLTLQSFVLMTSCSETNPIGLGNICNAILGIKSIEIHCQYIQ